MSEPISQPSESPPIHLVPRDAVLDPLPRPLTSFVGREHEIDAILRLLDSPNVRLLTLTGPGGAGKTRLALRVATRLEADCPDGVAFVGFDTTTDPLLVPVLIAQATGVPDVPGQSLSRRMHDHFRQRRILLVLDNLEHLPGIEADIADLLADSTALTLLCTSRVSLDITAEHVYPVSPLTPEDATELFAQRARAVSPDFNGYSEWVAPICDRLEYLPLAIELAAARVNILPLPSLLTRLDRQLPLLTGGPRDAPARHRTMRDTIVWSLDLLDPDDRILLRRLAVFSGGFSLEAAGQVCNDGVDALDGVSRLVAAGIVRRMPGPSGDARFRLPVVIREFAGEQLEAHGEGDGTRTRHAIYYRDLAEFVTPYLDGPENPAYRDRIVAERDNCRAAMTWAISSDDGETAIRLAGALWRTWWPSHAIGGRAWTENIEEGLSWIERTLPHRGELPLRIFVEGLIGAGMLTCLLGRIPESEVYLHELLRLSESQHDPYGEYWACFRLGLAAYDSDDLDSAGTLLKRALETAPNIRNPENHAAQTLGCLSNWARDRGNEPDALRFAEEGLRLAQACGNPHNISWLGLVAGRLRHKAGDEKRAVQCLIAGNEAYAADHDLGGVRATLTEMGRVALALDQMEIAKTLLVAANGLPAHEHDRPVHDAAMAELASRLNKTPGELAVVGEAELPLDELLDLARSLETAPTPPSQRAPSGLTPRELEVLKLIATGLSNRLIAGELFISERTVGNHVLHILAKLGLESRTAAAAWAVRHGLD